MHRRTLLRGAAVLGMGGLSFLKSMRARAAGAGSAPKRLVVLVRTHGNAQNEGDFIPVGSGALNISAASALSPLLPFQKKVSVVSGMKFDNFTGTSGFGTHLAFPYVLTCREGVKVSDGGWDGGGAPYGYSAGGASLDQHVAAKLGAGTPVPSLAIRESPDSNINAFFSYAGAPVGGLPNSTPTADSPLAVWERLFKGQQPTAGMTEAPADVRRRLIHPRVERLLSEYGARLTGAEKGELEQHLAVVQKAKVAATALSSTCNAIAKPSTDSLAPAQRFDVYSSLMVEALRCDATRVISFAWGGQPGEGYGWKIPQDTAQTAQPDAAGGEEHGTVGHMDENNRSARTKTVDRWYVERYASLLAKMDAIPEGDGTLLDNSLVVFANRDSDHPNHSYDDLSWIVAGGAGGAFRGGQALRWVSGSPKKLERHSHLLVTLCQALGVDPTGFARDGDHVLNELLT